jgi:hypothetical protein
VGKNARNKLNAIACDMIPQRGNTRVNTFQTLVAKSDLALLRIIAVACPAFPDFLPQADSCANAWLLSRHLPFLRSTFYFLCTLRCYSKRGPLHPPIYSFLEPKGFALILEPLDEVRFMSKISVLTLFVCLSLAPAAHAQQLTAAELKEKAAEDEVKRQELVTLQNETVRAIQMNNTAFFRRVYSDDYIGTMPGGRILDKGALLTFLQSSSSSTKYTTFLATDIRIRIYEDTAVVTCLWSSRGTSDGRNFMRQSRVTTVYVYGLRGWSAVASQETQLPG